MPVEIKGQQLRFRIRNPKIFGEETFRTYDIRGDGKLQRVAGQLKSTGEWRTQAWHINMKDYYTLNEIKSEITGLHKRQSISDEQAMKAYKQVTKWWEKNYKKGD